MLSYIKIASGFLLALFLGQGIAISQTSDTVPLSGQARMTADWPQWRWTILAGDDALKSGLASMADDLYQQALLADIPQSARESVLLKRVSALIAQRKFSAARDIMALLPPSQNGAYLLRKSILNYDAGAYGEVEAALAELNPETLSRDDQPWFFLMSGLIAKRKGELEASAIAFENAMELAVTPAQDAQFETILLTTRLDTEEDSEDLLELLRKKSEANHGTRPGFGYAREYAVALDRAGRESEAIAVLQEQLPLIETDENDEKAQTLIMIALIAGLDSRRGQLALEEVLSTAQRPSDQRIALYMLADAERTEEQRAAFQSFLNGLIAEGDHPIGDELLLLRARYYRSRGQTELATQDAEQLLSQYPASSFGSDARWLLAYQAWEDKRYRTAADYLQQIREGMPQGSEWRYLGQLVADCYFLNGDFATAAGVYQSILQDEAVETIDSSVGYQMVMALIELGDLQRAAQALDDLQQDERLDADYLWRAEWNLVEAMRQADQTVEAFTRLSRKLGITPFSALQPELRLRLMWLSAYLTFEAAEYAEVPRLVNDALFELSQGQAAILPDSEKQILASNLLLLQAQAELRSGAVSAGMTTLAGLRKDYPNTDAAVRSYLVEARFLAGAYRSAEAQLRLREMADNYPDSKQAPIALLEAALMAEKQGQSRNFEEAREILKMLIERYPNAPEVFHAKLSMGNLARKLNQFGAAQILYENVLRDYADRDSEFPLYLAELYRADSLLAQSANDTSRLDGAAESLDRVMDNPDTPLDALTEAGYKQALIHWRQGNNSRARESIWLMVTRYLKDPVEAQRLGPRGRYWLSRALLELAQRLDASGESSEANDIYDVVIDYELPGRTLVQARRGSGR